MKPSEHFVGWKPILVDRGITITHTLQATFAEPVKDLTLFRIGKHLICMRDCREYLLGDLVSTVAVWVPALSQLSVGFGDRLYGSLLLLLVTI